VREAIEPCESGFVAARDFREQLQKNRSAVLLSGRALQRRVHHGIPSSIVFGTQAAPGHPALEGPYPANTECRPKKFRRRRIGDDFLTSGGPTSFETPAG
jgi:hypothetical protein